MDLLILVSGELGLKCLRDIFNNGHSVKAVMTDKRSLAIQQYCAAHSIPLWAGNPNSEDGIRFVMSHHSSCVLSINYLFLLKEGFLSVAPKARFNIHGSLLPHYRGRTPHVWAIINGEREVGVTVHEIELGCDTGRILIQEKVSVTEEDTGGSILEKYKELYPKLLEESLAKIKSGRYNLIEQEHSQATYFPKRSPEDGLIDWSWNTKKLVNWIRALTQPYPGAFTHLPGGKKWIIWEVKSRKIPEIMVTDNPGTLRVVAGETVVRTTDGALSILSADDLSFAPHLTSSAQLF